MVKFEYKNSITNHKKFMLYTTFVHNKKMILPIFFGSFSLISLILVCVGFYAWLSIAIACLILGGAYLLITYYMVNKTIKKQLAKSKNFEKIKNEYTFSIDGFTVLTLENKKPTESAVSYDSIVSVKAYKNFYYLYVNNQMAFILDANGIINGSENEFKQIITTATDKKRCKIKV